MSSTTAGVATAASRVSAPSADRTSLTPLDDTRRRAIRPGLAVLACLLAAACQGPEPDAAAKLKQDYQTAASDIVAMVAVMSGYLPHLHSKNIEGKYAPKRRPDLLKAASYAANGVRSAANRARLKCQASSSPVSKALAEPFIEVTKRCADAEDEPAIAKCDVAIKALDAALVDAGTKAGVAGVSEFPRLGPGAVTDAARKEMDPFLQAIGGGKEELRYYASLSDDKATPSDVIAACETAQQLAETRARALENIDVEAKKVGATHSETLKGQCARLSGTHTVQQEIKLLCAKDKKTSECRQACGKGKAVLNEGVLAAAFAALPQDYLDNCKEEDDRAEQEAAEDEKKRAEKKK